MNGVSVGNQSSQCQWSPAPEPARVIEALDPVRGIALITAGAHHPLPELGRRLHAPLSEVLASGAALALSDPRNETHDVVLVRNKKVWLLLTPDTFYKAGLEAKKTDDRYLAVYDTTVPGKRLDRFNWALENTLAAPQAFFVTTETAEATASGSGSGGAESLVEPVPLLVPPLHPPVGSDANEEGFADWANGVVEWAGLAAASPELLSGEPVLDRAIADGYVPEDAELRRAAVSRRTGVFTAEQVLAVWAGVADQAWAVMSVQGFEQLPISVRSEKVRGRGELGYTLVRHGRETSVFRYVH